MDPSNLLQHPQGRAEASTARCPDRALQVRGALRDAGPVRHDRRQLPPMVRTWETRASSGADHVVVEGLHERAIRNGEVLVTTAEQHAGTGVKARPAVCAASADLPTPGSPEIKTTSRPSPAATRLKPSESNLAGFRGRSGRPRERSPGAGQRRALGTARATRRAVPADLEDLEGLGQSLQLHLAQGAERVADATPAIILTNSVVRIWPPSAWAHRRAASTIGSPK